jgi:hypothetical protein
MFVEQEHLPEHPDRVRRPAARTSSARTLARFDQERAYRSNVFSNLRTPFLTPKFRLSLKLLPGMSALCFHIHAVSFCRNPLVFIFIQDAPGVYPPSFYPFSFKQLQNPLSPAISHLCGRRPTRRGQTPERVRALLDKWGVPENFRHSTLAGVNSPSPS